MDSRGAGRGGGRGGRGGHDDPIVKTSKSLSFLLRHGAQKEGVPIRVQIPRNFRLMDMSK